MIGFEALALEGALRCLVDNDPSFGTKMNGYGDTGDGHDDRASIGGRTGRGLIPLFARRERADLAPNFVHHFHHGDRLLRCDRGLAAILKR